MRAVVSDETNAESPKEQGQGLSTNAPTGDLTKRPPLLADAVRRRWVLVAGTTAFFTLAAMASGQLRHASYDASTSVIVYPVAGAPFAQQATGNQLVDLSTEAQLVRSDAVAKLAQQTLARKGYTKLTEAGLISRVLATVEANTQVLRITYSAGAPRRARDGADAFAAAYLSYRQSLAKADAAQGLATIATSRVSLQKALSLDEQALGNAAPSSAAAGRLRAQVKVDEQSLTDLAAQEADLSKRPTLPGEVLSPATLPASPHGTSPPILGALGFLAGLAVGVVVAVARERRVGRIRRAASLPDEPPVLAVVPITRSAEPVGLTNPAARSADAYRLLYLAVDAALPVSSHRGNIIVVASLTDPAPPVGVNLAVAAAGAGRVTTYVDALPRRKAPRLPALPSHGGGPGFAEALLGDADAVALRVHVAPGFSVLPAGADISRAASSYGGPRTQRVLEALRRAADLVVIGAPPLTDPDGQALANVADAVIIAVPVGIATFDQLETAVVEASRVHAHVLGVVATHPARARSSAKPPSPAAAPDVVAGDEQPTAPASWVPS
jgi:Mrp family chromosome partitioning ATPase